MRTSKACTNFETFPVSPSMSMVVFRAVVLNGKGIGGGSPSVWVVYSKAMRSGFERSMPYPHLISDSKLSKSSVSLRIRIIKSRLTAVNGALS